MTPEQMLQEAFTRFLNTVMGNVNDKSVPELMAWKASLLSVADYYQAIINLNS